MIKVITGQFDNLEYDVRGIATSFYPGQEIYFVCDAEEGCGIPEGCGGEIVVDLEEIFGGAAVSKNELRKKLYNHLKERTGRELPWGILIGIRPTKLARKKQEAGASIVETAKWMQEEYFVSPEKSVLASVIAARELGVVSANEAQDFGAESFSLYVGIPFCPSRCLYCSFASQPINLWKDKTAQYVAALTHELEAMREMTTELGMKCQSIYVGGGTPTALPDEDFRAMLEKVAELFLEDHMEFTVEAGRPDSITAEKLSIMRNAGVNRISINPQSMNQKTLDVIGRSHSVSDIEEKFQLAREKGFDNINMDIILGLPGETPADVQHTIEEIAKLNPESLTVHALAIKRAARLNMESEGVPQFAVTEDDAVQMMRTSQAGASAMNLNPYYMYRQKNMAGNLENVGYAAEGKECYYNIVMMEEMESIIACGAGTVSKVLRVDETIERCDTHKDPKLYIEQIDEMIARKRELFAHFPKE